MIVYTSEYQGDSKEIASVLKDISCVAKLNNPKVDITGVLFYHNRRFLQVIEANKAALEDLMQRIANDNRHKNIVRLLDEPILNKSFSSWNMDSFNLDDEDRLEISELKNITEAYKKSVSTRSDLLTRFYKAMIKSHEFKKC